MIRCFWFSSASRVASSCVLLLSGCGFGHHMCMHDSAAFVVYCIPGHASSTSHVEMSRLTLHAALCLSWTHLQQQQAWNCTRVYVSRRDFLPAPCITAFFPRPLYLHCPHYSPSTLFSLSHISLCEHPVTLLSSSNSFSSPFSLSFAHFYPFPLSPMPLTLQPPASDTYKLWLRKQYNSFFRLLLRLLHHVDPRVQACSLHGLMDVLAVESKCLLRLFIFSRKLLLFLITPGPFLTMTSIYIFMFSSKIARFVL